MTTNQTNPAQSVYPASNAAASCIGADGAAEKSIVVNRVDKPPTGNGGGQPRNGSMETQQATRNGRFYLPSGFTRNCDHCKQPYTAKRDTSRFCSSVCRVNSHRARHEAGGGRVMTFIWLAVVVAVAWFLWPLANDLAAVRPRLPQAAVNQAGQGVTLQPTQTPATFAPLPKLGETISPAGLIRFEAAGRVWELPMDRLNDCITAQAAGRRTGNNCPPNAAAALAGATLPQMAAPGAALAGAGAELLHPEAAYIDPARFGDAIAYCLAGDWTPDQRAAVVNGFNVWQPAGVTFYEANWGECETAVSWSDNLGANVAGRASVGPGEIMLSPYWAGAGGCDLAMTAAHEAGHILGLNDQAAGIMGNITCTQTQPTAAELAAVAALWGRGK